MRVLRCFARGTLACVGECHQTSSRSRQTCGDGREVHSLGGDSWQPAITTNHHHPPKPVARRESAHPVWFCRRRSQLLLLLLLRLGLLLLDEGLDASRCLACAARCRRCARSLEVWVFLFDVPGDVPAASSGVVTSFDVAGVRAFTGVFAQVCSQVRRLR